jgi:hypothetical protein
MQKNGLLFISLARVLVVQPPILLSHYKGMQQMLLEEVMHLSLILLMELIIHQLCSSVMQHT